MFGARRLPLLFRLASLPSYRVFAPPKCRRERGSSLVLVLVLVLASWREEQDIDKVGRCGVGKEERIGGWKDGLPDRLRKGLFVVG